MNPAMVFLVSAQLLVALGSIGVILTLFGPQPPLVSVVFLLASAVALEAERLSGSLTAIQDRLAYYGQYGLLAPAMVAVAEVLRETTGAAAGQVICYLMAVVAVVVLRDRLSIWLFLAGRGRSTR